MQVDFAGLFLYVASCGCRYNCFLVNNCIYIYTHIYSYLFIFNIYILYLYFYTLHIHACKSTWSPKRNTDHSTACKPWWGGLERKPFNFPCYSDALGSWMGFKRLNLHPCRWQNKTWWYSFCLSCWPVFFNPLLFFVCLTDVCPLHVDVCLLFPVYLVSKHGRAMLQTFSHLSCACMQLQFSSVVIHNQRVTGCSMFDPWIALSLIHWPLNPFPQEHGLQMLWLHVWCISILTSRSSFELNS